MPWSLIKLLTALPAFMVILARGWADWSSPRPSFQAGRHPRLKVCLVFSMSVLLFPMLEPRIPDDISFGVAVTGIVAELLIGLAMGLSLTMFMMGIEWAGAATAQQAGLSLGQIFDPSLNEETTTLSQAYSIVFFLAFLSVGGHRAIVAALMDTYEQIHPMTFSMHSRVLLMMAEVLTSAMILAVRLSGPVLISLMLLSLTMGFLSRTLPQLNILSVGFSLRAVLALGMAGISLAAADELILDAMTNAIQAVRDGMGLGLRY